ncbi:UNVERIFIED_CONTAM: hypothetical protein FKN15_016891 [Acipenser sinensis]
MRRRRILNPESCTPNPDEEEEDTEPRVVHPKTDEQRCRLQEACLDILLFKSLDPEQMSQVLDAMFEHRVQPQEHVIDQGDDGDNFYEQMSQVLDAMFEHRVQPQEHVIDQGDDGDNFYVIERAFQSMYPAALNTVCSSCVSGVFFACSSRVRDGRRASLLQDRVTFRRLVLKNNAKKRKTYETFVESVPLLKSLELQERMKIVDVIGVKNYQDGERIITQGDKADCFYIVESGEVRIMMKSKTKADQQDNAEVEIARCSHGQYFGELALVTNKPRAASAYAVGGVKCLIMDIQAFERLLGSCKEIMKRNISHYEEQLVALFGSSMDLRD